MLLDGRCDSAGKKRNVFVYAGVRLKCVITDKPKMG